MTLLETETAVELHFRFIWGPVDLNTKLRKNLNGGTLKGGSTVNSVKRVYGNE
jgi:hypothetical protein